MDPKPLCLALGCPWTTRSREEQEPALVSRVAGAYVGTVVPPCSCPLPPWPCTAKDPISLQDLWQINLKHRAPGLWGTLLYLKPTGCGQPGRTSPGDARVLLGCTENQLGI